MSTARVFPESRGIVSIFVFNLIWNLGHGSSQGCKKKLFHKLKMNENSLARPSGFENLTSILSCPLCRRASEEIVPPDT